MRVVIVGSGPCGLGAGLEFKQLGHNSWHIYEQSDCYGGLSASLTENGYTWDYGGHVLFSHYGYYDDVLKIFGPSCNHLERNAVVFMHDGAIVDYPIQKSVAQMKPEAARRALHGLLDVRLDQHFRVPQSILNFEDWSISKMGLGIHEMFMKPYNEKLWNTQMNQMGFGWVGERVAVPDFQELLEMKTDLTWGPNHMFLYPKSGGVGAIWNQVALKVVGKQNITLSSKLTFLDPIEKSVFVGSEIVEYDRLISTIPLVDLISTLNREQFPQFAELSAAVESLRYNAVLIVGLGIFGQEPKKIRGFHWAYVPDSAVPFYRCTVLSHYSESMAPAGHYSLMLECSLPEETKSENSDMLNRCCQACSDLGLLDLTMIVHKWIKIIPKGYPIPTIDRDSQLERIHNILEQYDIFSRGRFGGWKYEVANMDHCMMQGVEIARRICNDKKEITYPSPNFVNNPKNRSAIDLDFRFLCQLPV